MSEIFGPDQAHLEEALADALADTEAYGDQWEDLPRKLQQRIIDLSERVTSLRERRAADAPSVVSDLSRMSRLPASPSGVDRAALDRKYCETQHLVPRQPQQHPSYAYDQAPRQQQEQQPPQPQLDGQGLLDRLKQQRAPPSTPPSHQGRPRIPGGWSTPASPALQRTLSLLQRSSQSERHVSSPSHDTYSSPIRPISTGPLRQDTFSSSMPATGIPPPAPNLGHTPAAVPTTTPKNSEIEHRRQRLAEIEREFHKASNDWTELLHAVVDKERSMRILLAEREHILVELREHEGLPAVGRLGLGADAEPSGTSKKKKNRPSKHEKKAAKAAAAAKDAEDAARLAATRNGSSFHGFTMQ